VQVGCVHAENEDNTTNFADQDGEHNRDVSLVLFPTRHEVVSGPNQALPLYDLNPDGDTYEANAEVVRHSAEQDQRAVVKVDIPNRLLVSGVLEKPILKVGERDYNKDLNDGGEHHFWDHRVVHVVAEDVAGASSGDLLEHHLHEGGHHEI
jgi:hypothetical protein